MTSQVSGSIGGILFVGNPTMKKNCPVLSNMFSKKLVKVSMLSCFPTEAGREYV